MNRQTFKLLRILLDPQITATPLRVLRQLRKAGKQRLPEPVARKLEKGRVGRLGALGFIRQWLNGEQLSRHHGQWVLNSFLPPFPGPAFDRMFENLLSGRHLSPVSAYLSVTHDCPYDCWHCSLKNRRTGHLSESDWVSAISQLHGLGTSVMGFTGGEPLAREDLPALVRAASSGGAATILFTSGALLTEAKAEALKEAGLWAICVSLDHTEAAEYDKQRGCPGAFDRALAAIRLSRQAGFYTMIGSVATRPMIEEQRFADLYKLARKLGVHEYRLVEPMPCGRLADADDSHLLNSEHIRDLRRFHVETNRLGRLPKVCAFNQVESPELFGCGGGTQHLYIDPAGHVCPCDFTPMSFGNVRKQELKDIWRRMNRAMGDAPRRHCFIQKHHKLIASFAEKGYPLEPEQSEQVCRQAGSEPMPDYIALVTGGNQQ